MKTQPDRAVIGLISDTHGLLRPSVHGALSGVSLILHAGDVGGQEILDELGLIAPVHAVFGNTDPQGDPSLRGSIELEAGGLSIHVSHGHELGIPTPARLFDTYPQDVIVYGHTHRQSVVAAGGRLAVNPGAAGQKRFKLMPSVARLVIAGGRGEVEIVTLD
ncbi:MAG: metallophosphatase family protein [Gemmatimonadota bacterium]|nr:metallophosphatase family protein [Gemmatimonadota bacterium]